MRVSFSGTSPWFRCTRVVLLLLVTLCAAPPALAYDGDTHYAWTYYLALQVGYTPRQAYQLASAAWAIDHDVHTGPLHATKRDAYSGDPDPVIERVWRRFHAFADAVYVGRRPDVDSVRERRREGEETLAEIGARQRNIGAQIHYLQDYFAHNEYDSVRGHFLWGHIPDRIGHRPNRARAMTKRTIEALTAFAPSVGVTPRQPDEERLWEVLTRLNQVNPSLLVKAESAGDVIRPEFLWEAGGKFADNYDMLWDAIGDLDLGFGAGVAVGVIPYETVQTAIDRLGLPRTLKQAFGIQKIAWADVNLDGAVDVVNAALREDAEVARIRRFPADWTLPKIWIQYDFDADGLATAETLAKNHFPVEQLKVVFAEANVAFRRDASSASLYEVTVQQRYTLEGMATLPAFRAIPLVERSAFSDDIEQMHRDRDRAGGSYVMERKVLRPRAALLDGSLTWTPSIDLFGQTYAAPKVTIRLGDDSQWYVVALNATGYDLRSGGVRTDAGGGAPESRSGLHRRRGSTDLVVVRVDRGGPVAPLLAEIRKIVAEPHCRRAAVIAPTDSIEPPGADLAGLPQYWDDLALEVRGPFPSRDLARSAVKPGRWEALEFVEKPNLADIEFRSGCRSQVAAPPVLVTVPDVVGSRADQAEARLRTAGLLAYLESGAPPRTIEEQYTVERQVPAANSPVVEGSSVRIAIRPAFVEALRAVPDVSGLLPAAAQQRLESAGFTAQMAGGDPAPSAERAFTVQDQRPAAGAPAAPGSTVVVRIFSRPDRQRVVPNVVGLAAAEAERRLSEVGLVAVTQGGDPAPSRETAFTVQTQQPAGGAPAEAGDKVQVRIHSAFVTAEVRADPPDPPRIEPPARPPGADPKVFRCPPYGAHSVRPQRLFDQQRYARCPPSFLENYSHEGRGVSVSAYWYTSLPQNSVGRCGAPPAFRYIPASTFKMPFYDSSTGQTTYSESQVPGGTGATYWGTRGLAVVTLVWNVDSLQPIPPALAELAQQVLAEAEWRGASCDGGAAPPAASAPPPPPVRAPAPAPAPAPADNRPLCTCVDEAGRPYRMLLGQECDPRGSGRDDNCRP